VLARVSAYAQRGICKVFRRQSAPTCYRRLWPRPCGLSCWGRSGCGNAFVTRCGEDVADRSAAVPPVPVHLCGVGEFCSGTRPACTASPWLRGP